MVFNQAAFKRQLLQNRSLAAAGPIKTNFTVKELAALHLAATAVLDVVPESDEDGVLARATREAELMLKKHGCRLDSQGWSY